MNNGCFVLPLLPLFHPLQKCIIRFLVFRLEEGKTLAVMRLDIRGCVVCFQETLGRNDNVATMTQERPVVVCLSVCLSVVGLSSV